jgi:hypothetical protein
MYLEVHRANFLFSNMYVQNISGWTWIFELDLSEPLGVISNFVVKDSSFIDFVYAGVVYYYDDNYYDMYVPVNFTNCFFDQYVCGGNEYFSMYPDIGQVNIDNCHFSNMFSYDGDDMYLLEAFNPDIAIRNSTFTNIFNSGTSDYAYLIYQGYSYYENTVLLQNVSFKDIVFYGGSIVQTWRGIITVDVSNSSFKNITCVGSYASVFFVYSYQVTSFIQNSLFQLINGPLWYGMYRDYDSSSLDVNGCQFLNITSFSSTGPSFQIVEAYQPQSISLSDCAFVGGTLASLVSLHTQTNLTVKNCNFSNFVQSQPMILTTQNTLTSVSNCRFVNLTSSQGGSVLQLESLAIALITASEFSRITSDGAGGSIMGKLGSSLTVIGSRFSEIIANSHGGAIHFQGQSLFLADSTFSDCLSEYTGGAIRIESSTSSFVSGCIFTNNIGKSAGGAVYISG